MYRVAFALTVVGALLLIIAIALPFAFPMLFDSQISSKLVIKEDSDMLKSFKKTPVPIYLQIWFFNVTNPNAILNGSKPILNQVGPYTYLQTREREDIRWNDEIGTVIFNPRKNYYFKPELSVGPDSDLVTTINPVFTTLASKFSADSLPGAATSIAQLLFMRFNSMPFMTRSVKELTFAGYDEQILGELYQVTRDPLHKLAKFGFFYPKNGTKGGEEEIYSGKLGMSNYQNYYKYHGKEKQNIWKEDRCNLINGTSGSQFPRPVAKYQSQYLYTAELCRSIYLLYEKDVYLGPLPLNRFVLPMAVLEKNEENSCFCSSDFTCRAGMIDVSPCRNGAPVLISLPHFYQGSEEDVSAVEGLNPLKEEHELVIDIEPETGVVMRAAKRIQINMPLRRYGNLPALLKVPELILPVLWVNESVEVPMERVEKLYTTLTLPKLVVTYGCWGILVTGLVFIIIAFILTVATFKRASRLQKRRQEISDKKINSATNNVSLLEKKIYQVS